MVRINLAIKAHLRLLTSASVSNEPEMSKIQQKVNPMDTPRHIALLVMQTDRCLAKLPNVSSCPVNAGPSMRPTASVVFRECAGAAAEQEVLTEWRQIPPWVRAAIKKVHEAHSHAQYK